MSICVGLRSSLRSACSSRQRFSFRRHHLAVTAAFPRRLPSLIRAFRSNLLFDIQTQPATHYALHTSDSDLRVGFPGEPTVFNLPGDNVDANHFVYRHLL